MKASGCGSEGAEWEGPRVMFEAMSLVAAAMGENGGTVADILSGIAQWTGGFIGVLDAASDTQQPSKALADFFRIATAAHAMNLPAQGTA